MSVPRSSEKPGSDIPGLAAALEQLSALHEGFAGVGAVIAIGPSAIGSLKTILWRVDPSGIFEVRQRAILALAALGADDALIEFIGAVRDVADPVAREGEIATLSSAARALKGSRDPRAFPAVLRLARRRPTLGAMETLGASRRVEAIPGLIRGLDEDDTRSAAVEGLRALGRESRCALLSAALTADDGPSTLPRRRAAMRLLSEIGLAPWQRADVRPLILHDDPALSLHACRALLAARDAVTAAACRDRLAALRPRLPPFLQGLAVVTPAARTATPPGESIPVQRIVRARRPLLHLTLPDGTRR